MLAIWFLGPLLFLNSACTSGSSWSLAWRILSTTLLACERSTVSLQFEHSLALLFFGTGMNTDLFQSCGHHWVFQIFWHVECNTLTASSFRILNSSAGIPSAPLALFISMVMLPKVHLTFTVQNVWLQMSNHTIMVTQVIKTFLDSSSVYSCHLSLISSASVNSFWLLSFIVPILGWNISLLSPIFLKRFLVFPILLFSSISLHCSFKKAFLSLLVILWNSAFSWVDLSLSASPFPSLLSLAICKAS